jgi:hypothetical protein
MFQGSDEGITNCCLGRWWTSIFADPDVTLDSWVAKSKCLDGGYTTRSFWCEYNAETGNYEGASEVEVF